MRQHPRPDTEICFSRASGRISCKACLIRSRISPSRSSSSGLTRGPILKSNMAEVMRESRLVLCCIRWSASFCRSFSGAQFFSGKKPAEPR